MRGLGDVFGPDGSGQAVEGFVGALDYFVDVLEFQDGHYRAEDFLARSSCVLNVGETVGSMK